MWKKLIRCDGAGPDGIIDSPNATGVLGTELHFVRGCSPLPEGVNENVDLLLGVRRVEGRADFWTWPETTFELSPSGDDL